MYTALTIVAVILAVVGIFALISGEIITAIILFIAAVLVGPGGYSIVGGRRRA